VSVSVPVLKLEAGTVKEYPPLLERIVDEVYVPAVSVTVPVGATLTPVEVTTAPATVPVTASVSFDDRVVTAGVTVTVALELPTVAGHALTTFATLREPRPVAWS
jgi:hypothetical protein